MRRKRTLKRRKPIHGLCKLFIINLTLRQGHILSLASGDNNTRAVKSFLRNLRMDD